MKSLVVCFLAFVACSQAAHLVKRQATDPTEDRDCQCTGTIAATWTRWDACSEDCRTTANPEQGRALECTTASGSTYNCRSQRATCHLMPCDDGMAWDTFNECDAPCGGGTRFRTSATDGTVQTVNCHTHSCDAVEGCGSADIIFVLDSSNSLSLVNWFRTKQFVIDMVKGLSIGKDSVRVAVITFSTEVKLEFGLDASYDVEDIERRLTNTEFMAGVTNTADALRLMRTTFEETGRADARKIAVVLTDGASNVFEATTIPNAKAARDNGVVIFSIGVGAYKEDELNGIASVPTADHSFTVNDYESLNTITNAAIQGTCDAASTLVCGEWAPQGTCSVSCGGGGSQAWVRTCTLTENGVSSSYDVTDIRQGCGDVPCDPCMQCDTRDGIGFIHDPEDCRRYYVCEKQTDGSFKRYHMCCAEMNFWSQEDLTCQGSPKIDECARIPLSVCDADTDDITTSAPSCDFLAVANEPTKYMFAGHKMSCAPGTVFSAAGCQCIHGDNNVQVCVSDPMLHFTFEENLDDVSCNKAQSQNYGNVHRRWGKKSQAAYFDGSSRLDVQFMNNWFAGQTIQHFSVALWFKRESGYGDVFAGLVNNGDCDAPSFEVNMLDSTHVSGSMDTFGAAIGFKQLAGYSVTEDSWYHAALVYNGNRLEFYLDGAKQTDKQTDNVLLQGFIENRQCPMQIGHAGRGDSNDGFFHGLIDDVRVYDRTLNSNEVLAIYNNGL